MRRFNLRVAFLVEFIFWSVIYILGLRSSLPDVVLTFDIGMMGTFLALYITEVIFEKKRNLKRAAYVSAGIVMIALTIITLVELI